jgi:iron complex outermembrane recepter protein
MQESPLSRLLMLIAIGACWSASAAAAESDDLPEVTVTAQKIAENVRTVPISISVVSADQLQDQHIVDIGDLTRVVPNFSFSSQGNPGGSVIEMRGISSAAGASTVGIYLDEVSITARTVFNYTGQPEPQLIDIDQIEVLRGPQGTLYGASSEAGVLKYRTNPVDMHDFSGSALADTSQTKHGGINYTVNGVLNAPIVADVLAIRLSAQTSYQDGYIDRYSPDTGALLDTRINDRRANAARLAIELKPADDLSIVAGLFYQRIDWGSTDTVTLGLPPLETNARVRDDGSGTMLVPSLTIRYDAGWADLTSVSSDYTRNQPFTYDGTAFNSVYIGQCFLDGLCGSPPIPALNGQLAGSKIAALPSPGIDGSFSRQISQELRLNSKPYSEGGPPLSWVVGVYYLNSTDRMQDLEIIPGFNQVFDSLYGPATLNALFGGPVPADTFFFGTTTFEEKQYSGFGDVTYHIGPALRLSAGLRYLVAHDSLTDAAGGLFNGGSTSYAVPSKDHALTPKFSIDYDLTDNTSVYSTISKGFRLGGPNHVIPTEFCAGDLAALGYENAPTSYGHDELWNYEVGAKARPAGQLAIDASLFYVKWSKLQQTFNLPTCGFSFSTNVGEAHSYGSELDIKARPIKELILALSAGVTHATLTQTVSSLGIFSGEHIEGVPEWNSNVSADYTRPLSAAIRGYIRANYEFIGPSFGSLITTDPDFHRPSYGLAGASIGALFDTWEVSVYSKNLFDEQKIIQTPDHSTVPVGFVLQPRTIGVSVSARFR